MLSAMDIKVWFLFFKRHRNFFIGSSITLLTLYIFWPLLEYKKNRKRIKQSKKPPGLINYGNTCFLNTLLQALASCERLKQTLEEQQRDDCPLIACLVNLLHCLERSTSNDGDICPADILSVLRRKNWSIESGQQDAFELFGVLMQTLQEEVLAVQAGLAAPVPMENGTLDEGLPSECLFVHRVTSVEPSPRPPVQPRLLVASLVRCTHCAQASGVSIQPEYSLSLTLPHAEFAPYPPRVSLESLLAAHCSPGIAEGSRCSSCGGSGAISRRELLARIPPTLCLHVQRTVWLPTQELPMKRPDRVSFPKLLNMTPYRYQFNRKKSLDLFDASFFASAAPVSILAEVSNETLEIQVSPPPSLGAGAQPINGAISDTACSGDVTTQLHNHNHCNSVGMDTEASTQPLDTPCNSSDTQLDCQPDRSLYELRAVIVHMGLPDSGHFATYRLWTGTWWYISDEDVHQVTEDEVLRAEAYMLFYERYRHLDLVCASADPSLTTDLTTPLDEVS